MNLLQRQIVMVTGKGGVGKTTVCMALGLWAARAGKRVLIVETEGASQVGSHFGVRPPGYTPTAVAPGLWVMTVTPEEAIEDYVVLRIKNRQLFRLVFKNRVLGPLLNGVPGLQAIVQLGKVYHLAEQRQDGRRRWDLIIVDAPATGHGVTMFDSPRSMTELTRKGPFFDGAKLVYDVIGDPSRTALLLVCLPEDMPVNETVELYERLGDNRSLVQGAVLNEMHPPPMPASIDWARFRGRVSALGAAAAEAAGLVDDALTRQKRQEQEHERLSRALPVPVGTLPFLFHRGLGRQDLQALSIALESQLGAR